MPPPRKAWRQARSELESFLKEQPRKFYCLIGDLALTNMGLGDKVALAIALAERAMAANPIEKDASWSHLRSRSSPE